MRAEAGKALDLLGRERRAQHTHGLRVAVLVQGDDVHVPFGENDVFLHRDGRPRLEEAEQVFTLLVDGGITAVDVLGVVFLGQRGDDTPAEGHGLPRKVTDGEHEPVAETVEGAARAALRLQATFHGGVQVEAGTAQGVPKVLPRIHAPAEAELFLKLGRDAALFNVVTADLGMGRIQVAVEVRGGKLMHLEHIALLRTLLTCLRIGPVCLELNACFLSKGLKRFLEIKAIQAAVEIKEISGSLTTETVERALFLVDGEGGLGLLMEGAGSNEARAHRAQFDITPCHIRKAYARFDRLYGIGISHHRSKEPS